MNRIMNSAFIGAISFGLILGLGSFEDAFAEKNKKKRRFPLGCQMVGFEYKHKLLVLKPVPRKYPHQAVFFIHNLSMKHDVRFKHLARGDEPYILNLNNRISPNRWGVFATDKQEVKFACFIPSKDSKFGQMVDCADYLDICEYPRAKFATNNRGNYWAISSMAGRSVKYSMIRQGVLLKWGRIKKEKEEPEEQEENL